MKLYLTRHGKTVENEKNVFVGQLDGTLSEKGIKQAKKLAERLKEEEFDAIYSSDLDRTAHTAVEIAKYHPNTPVYFVKDLRELDLRHLSGKDRGESRMYILDSDPEVESTGELYNRAQTFLDKIYKMYSNGQVLVAAHNQICRTLVAVMEGKSSSDIENIEKLKNTSVNIFGIIKEDDIYKCETITFNDITHLE